MGRVFAEWKCQASRQGDSLCHIDGLKIINIVWEKCLKPAVQIISSYPLQATGFLSYYLSWFPVGCFEAQNLCRDMTEVSLGLEISKLS